MSNKIYVYHKHCGAHTTDTIDIEYFRPYLDQYKKHWDKDISMDLTLQTREQVIAGLMSGRGMNAVSFYGAGVLMSPRDYCFAGYLGEKKTCQLNQVFQEERDYFYLLPRGFVHSSVSTRHPLTREEAEEFFEKELRGYSTFIDTPEKLIEYLRVGYPAWQKQAFQNFEKFRIEKKKKRNVISALKPAIESCGTVEQRGAVASVVKRSLRTRTIIQYSDGSFGFGFNRGHYIPYRDRRKAKRAMNRLTKKYRQILKEGTRLQ